MPLKFVGEKIGENKIKIGKSYTPIPSPLYPYEIEIVGNQVIINKPSKVEYGKGIIPGEYEVREILVKLIDPRTGELTALYLKPKPKKK